MMHTCHRDEGNASVCVENLFCCLVLERTLWRSFNVCSVCTSKHVLRIRIKKFHPICQIFKIEFIFDFFAQRFCLGQVCLLSTRQHLRMCSRTGNQLRRRCRCRPTDERSVLEQLRQTQRFFQPRIAHACERSCTCAA